MKYWNPRRTELFLTLAKSTRFFVPSVQGKELDRDWGCDSGGQSWVSTAPRLRRERLQPGERVRRHQVGLVTSSPGSRVPAGTLCLMPGDPGNLGWFTQEMTWGLESFGKNGTAVIPCLRVSCSFFILFYFYFYFWLCWFFVSVRGLSPVAASRGHSSSRCAGLSLSWPLLLQSTGSRRAGSVVVAHGPSCSAACGTFPDQGSNPCPLHRQADSQPLCHQGNP